MCVHVCAKGGGGLGKMGESSRSVNRRNERKSSYLSQSNSYSSQLSYPQLGRGRGTIVNIQWRKGRETGRKDACWEAIVILSRLPPTRGSTVAVSLSLLPPTRGVAKFNQNVIYKLTFIELKASM